MRKSWLDLAPDPAARCPICGHPRNEQEPCPDPGCSSNAETPQPRVSYTEGLRGARPSGTFAVRPSVPCLFGDLPSSPAAKLDDTWVSGLPANPRVPDFPDAEPQPPTPRATPSGRRR